MSSREALLSCADDRLRRPAGDSQRHRLSGCKCGFVSPAVFAEEIRLTFWGACNEMKARNKHCEDKGPDS